MEGSPTIHSIARRIKSAQNSGSLTQRPSNSITRRIAYRDGEAARRSPSISNSNGEQGHDGIGIRLAGTIRRCCARILEYHTSSARTSAEQAATGMMKAMSRRMEIAIRDRIAYMPKSPSPVRGLGSFLKGNWMFPAARLDVT